MASHQDPSCALGLFADPGEEVILLEVGQELAEEADVDGPISTKEELFGFLAGDRTLNCEMESQSSAGELRGSRAQQLRQGSWGEQRKSWVFCLEEAAIACNENSIAD